MELTVSISTIRPDVNQSVSGSARVLPPGYRKPKHGKGMLKNWVKGQSGRPPGVVATRYGETLALARAASPDAMRALIARLHDPDGRIVVVAANSILERAWGKVKEARPEEVKQAQIDLSALSGAELQVLMRLVESGRLRSAEPTDQPADPPIVIDAEPSAQ
jgi:hypothetical protein